MPEDYWTMQVNTLRCVLWDMDGVLVHTSQLHVEAWAHVLTELGVPFNPRNFNQIFGLKNSEFIHHIVLKQVEEQHIKAIIDQKENYFKQLGLHLQPLPGVLEWLERFKAWGCKQAIASSGEPENVEYICDVLKIREYFDALVTPGDLPGKPDPAVFLLAAKQLNIPTKNCLIIEDSVPGIEAARHANMHCIAVSNTNSPAMLSNADIVFESLENLTMEQLVSIFK